MVDIKAILSAASGVCRSPKARGAAALAVIAAGTVALASVDGKQEQIDAVPLETDTVVTETEPVKAEKKARTYARDLEYLSEEDLAAMNRSAEDSSADTDTEDEAEGADEYGSEENMGYTSCAECTEDDDDADEYDKADEDDGDSSDEDDDTYDDTDEDDSSEDNDGDSDSNETNSVSTYGYAADGEDGDTGLSSTLDMDSDHETDNDNDTSDNEEDSSDDTAEEAPKWVPLSTEGSADDDDDSDAEIITLDDEDVPTAETAETAETAAPAPQDGAISRFALPDWLEFDENGIPKNYSNVLSGNACAYTADPGALMSTGKEVFQGYVAVNPNLIPYGSELYIIADDGEVYGYAIAGDTGYSVRVGDIIVDLFMDEYDDCIQWGNKGVKIYVLS